MPTINVTACDNELYITASLASGAGTSEICHISSGYNNPVSYTVKLSSILAPGAYNLTMIGINWGGPAAYTVNVDSTPYTFSNGSAPVGVVWSKTIPVQV